LIGGFRYRLLDQSSRVSRDIDYHWEGRLEEKQEELLRLSRRKLIPEVRRDLGYDGRAALPSGPEAESPSARCVELVFWKSAPPSNQIVLPLEVTRIVCLDPMTVRTAEGVVYATASDLDLIEAKVLAVLNRLFVEHRDFVDIFLYGNRFSADSPGRIKDKLAKISSDRLAVRRRLDDLEQNVDYHSRTVQRIIDTQLDAVVAAQLNAAGGGRTVFAQAFQLIQLNVGL
jgi:hypothetical protein